MYFRVGLNTRFIIVILGIFSFCLLVYLYYNNNRRYQEGFQAVYINQTNNYKNFVSKMKYKLTPEEAIWIYRSLESGLRYLKSINMGGDDIVFNLYSFSAFMIELHRSGNQTIMNRNPTLASAILDSSIKPALPAEKKSVNTEHIELLNYYKEHKGPWSVHKDNIYKKLMGAGITIAEAEDFYNYYLKRELWEKTHLIENVDEKISIIKQIAVDHLIPFIALPPKTNNSGVNPPLIYPWSNPTAGEKAAAEKAAKAAAALSYANVYVRGAAATQIINKAHTLRAGEIAQSIANERARRIAEAKARAEAIIRAQAKERARVLAEARAFAERGIKKLGRRRRRKTKSYLKKVGRFAKNTITHPGDTAKKVGKLITHPRDTAKKGIRYLRSF